MQEMQVQSLGREDAPEEEIATHSSILAWKIPWTEEPGSVQSAGVSKSRTLLSNWTQHSSSSVGAGEGGRKHTKTKQKVATGKPGRKKTSRKQGDSWHLLGICKPDLSRTLFLSTAWEVAQKNAKSPAWETGTLGLNPVSDLVILWTKSVTFCGTQYLVF